MYWYRFFEKYQQTEVRMLLVGMSLNTQTLPRGGISLAVGHEAFSSCPYSVTELAVGYIGVLIYFML